MQITHTNRKGKLYYLHQGKTKTGKTRYYFSLKSDEKCIESIPPGYEIYENPNAKVFLRKIQPKVILDEEVTIVEREIKKHSKIKDFIIDVKDKNITVFLSDLCDGDAISKRKGPLANFIAKQLEQVMRSNASYSPMMRFVLVDTDKRVFCVERMCFRGGDDHWMSLHQYDDLEKLVRRYAVHLGEESFYELM